jgi:hypothetical protein
MKLLQTLALTASLFTTVCAGAQQIGQNTSAATPQGFTLSIHSQLIVETVTVKDKQGHFIPGLTAKDFALTEDGVPQTIRFCEHQNIDTLYKRLNRTQIAPEDSGSSRYKNRRLLALYFDMSTMDPADQLRALSAAEEFLRTQMTSADLVSILRYQGGSVDILQDFTADRNKLLSILQTLIVGEGQGSKESIDDAGSADTGAAFGQDDSQFNVFNTDRQLSALETASKIKRSCMPRSTRPSRPASRSGRSMRAAWSPQRRSATQRRARPATQASTPAPRPRHQSTICSTRRTPSTHSPATPAARRSLTPTT